MQKEFSNLKASRRESYWICSMFCNPSIVRYSLNSNVSFSLSLLKWKCMNKKHWIFWRESIKDIIMLLLLLLIYITLPDFFNHPAQGLLCNKKISTALRLCIVPCTWQPLTKSRHSLCCLFKWNYSISILVWRHLRVITFLFVFDTLSNIANTSLKSDSWSALISYLAFK